MVLTKEYHIAMPLTVEEYQIGQLYMIARHSLEQSGEGEGVEVVENSPCEDPEYGKEYTCSFIPKLTVSIKTKYEDNNGSSENCLGLTDEQIKARLVEEIDIAFDELTNTKHYKREEDPKFFKSDKTNRGPLMEGWRITDTPIMCSYKVVHASFEVWGLQTKVEDFIQRSIKEVLLLGHRQAFTWIDEWYGMTLDDVREFERQKQAETNEKLNPNNAGSGDKTTTTNGSKTPTKEEIEEPNHIDPEEID